MTVLDFYGKFYHAQNGLNHFFDPKSTKINSFEFFPKFQYSSFLKLYLVTCIIENWFKVTFFNFQGRFLVRLYLIKGIKNCVKVIFSILRRFMPTIGEMGHLDSEINTFQHFFESVHYVFKNKIWWQALKSGCFGFRGNIYIMLKIG